MQEIIRKIQSVSNKIVVITDGKRGVYAYDGHYLYKCPEFPAKVISTLGAGDAFASTFCGALKRTDRSQFKLNFSD